MGLTKMNENNNNQNDQPTEKQQPSDETQAEYREISEDDLKQILEDHEKWLESDGKEGKQADLNRTDLQGVNLSKANLQNANLKEANLQETYLSEANLQEAHLYKANLQKAELSEANLQKAFLWRANLLEAGLKEANLQKADLSDANLQEAYLSEANLQEANLYKANLQKAELSEANLQKAYLEKANLQEAFLRGANLQDADFLGANLKKAYFMEANLEGTILVGANLQEANLYNVDMRNTALGVVKGLSEANLQYTNLEGTIGLLGHEFAQAELIGTKLPKNIKDFKALEIVKETSQNARKIFFAMLLGCVYSWLTIATTTDVRLLTNTASSPLPIIGTEIPIAGFYIAAPLVLICLFFYFHLYLDNLWKGLASLPAIFPDGKPLDQTAYPWLLNSLVNRHFKILKKRAELKEFEKLKVKTEKILKKFKIEKDIYIRPLISYLKEWITIFLAWWVVPITMIAFWLRYIPRHDWVGTCFHIGLIVVSVASAIFFYRLCALTLQGKKKIVFRLQNFWRERRFYYGVIIVLVGILFLLLSYGAIEGYRLRDTNFNSMQHFIPWAFDKIGYNVFVDFKEKELSEKPDNYWQLSMGEKPNSVKGINFRNTNLNNGDLSQTFLINADIRDASLCYANFSKADIRYADFTNSILRGADLSGAIIKDTEFKNADLREADLTNQSYIPDYLFCKAKTLYKAKMEDSLKDGINSSCPAVLEKPKEEGDQKDQEKKRT
jgi:uncharacterized protein YjbI with pentapeptide repeats